MTTPLPVVHTVKDASGRPVAGAPVKARPFPPPVFDGATEVLAVEGRANALGVAQLDLIPNDAFSPAGTVYEWWEAFGVQSRKLIIRLDSTNLPAGPPYRVEDLLTTAPGALPEAALAEHLSDALDAHDASAISVVPFGAVTADDVQSALEQLGPNAGAYHHSQAVPSSVWSITHNLGFRPGGVIVIDSAGSVAEGDLSYIDADRVELIFSGTFAGDAYLS